MHFWPLAGGTLMRFYSLPRLAIAALALTLGFASGSEARGATDWASGVPSEDGSANETAKQEAEEGSAIKDVVVVTGTRVEESQDKSAVRTEAIDRATIDASGAENLGELLEHFPGLDVVRSFRGSALRINGFDPKYVLILVNGRRQIGDLGGAIDLERFPVSQVERVEIVKGASSGLYGSRALGGVVNIITRRSIDAFEGQLHLVGTWGADNEAAWASSKPVSDLDASGRIGVNGDWWASDTTLSYRDASAIRYEPESYGTTFPDASSYQIYNQTTFDLSDTFSVNFGADYTLRNQEGQDESAPKPTAFGLVTEEFQVATVSESISGFMGLDLQVENFGKLNAESSVQVFNDQYLSDLVDGVSGGDKDKYETSDETLGDLRLQLDSDIRDNDHLILGLETQYHELSGDRLDAESLSRLTSALYSQYQWLASGELDSAGEFLIVPALRFDLDSQYGPHVSPKVAGRYALSDWSFLRTWTGSGFVAPGFKELGFLFENLNVGYKVLGNPNLSPETSWDFGAQWVAAPTKALRFELSAYGSLIENQILALPCSAITEGDAQAVCLGDEATSAAGPVYVYKNVGEARSVSFEVAAQTKFLRRFTLRGSYVHSDIRSLDEDEDTWSLLPDRPLHKFSADLRYFEPFSATQVTLRGSYCGKRLLSGGGSSGQPRVYADSYLSLDFKVQQPLSENWSISVQGQNLMNEYDPMNLVIRPRTLSAGLDVRL
ncbi:MAG: TonB-dependent receptor [Myxococcota bacterium]|nr:TonB-dependent receptor [Myxococcota bacterium]